MTTITPQQTPKIPRQRGSVPSRHQAAGTLRNRRTTLMSVAVVVLVGAVAAMWFALVSGSEAGAPAAPGDTVRSGGGALSSGLKESAMLQQQAQGSDQHLYRRQPGDVTAGSADRNGFTEQELQQLAGGSDRHLAQRQPSVVTGVPSDQAPSDLTDGSDRHLFLAPRG